MTKESSWRSPGEDSDAPYEKLKTVAGQEKVDNGTSDSEEYSVDYNDILYDGGAWKEVKKKMRRVRDLTSEI